MVRNYTNASKERWRLWIKSALQSIQYEGHTKTVFSKRPRSYMSVKKQIMLKCLSVQKVVHASKHSRQMNLSYSQIWNWTLFCRFFWGWGVGGGEMVLWKEWRNIYLKTPSLQRKNWFWGMRYKKLFVKRKRWKSFIWFLWYELQGINSKAAVYWQGRMPAGRQFWLIEIFGICTI